MIQLTELWNYLKECRKRKQDDVFYMEGKMSAGYQMCLEDVKIYLKKIRDEKIPNNKVQDGHGASGE